MLIEFRVENHRSLRDEQVFTMTSGSLGAETDERPRAIEGFSDKVLPAAVLYGANASGKSNVLSAIAFMKEAVMTSYRYWDPESGVPRSPFAWGSKRSEPSTFEVLFVWHGCRYEYGFVVSDDYVEEEWLYAWPAGRKQIWYERDRGEFKFGENLAGPNEVINQVTRPNALFLSVASQHKHPQLSEVFSWFRNVIPTNVPSRMSPQYARGLNTRFLISGFGREAYHDLFFDSAASQELVVTKIRQLLKIADTGIVDIEFATEDVESQPRQLRRERIRLKHQVSDDDSWIDFDEESQGTRTLFGMAIPIFRAMSNGGVLLVDELESSLHPLLGSSIVKMFNCPKTNSNNAQIIFTTHDTNLLGTTLGEPSMRRDQIWFTEKEASGASRLYPLTDFHPRKAENLERGYLQGRYGSIPFLGDMGLIAEHD